MRWLEKLLKQKSKKQNVLLGELLRKARTDAGLTQTQAAAHLARDQTFMARLESGLQQPTFVEVEQLARVYGKQVEEFRTLNTIEQRERNLSVAPDKTAEYADLLLQRQKRRRQTKKQHPRKSRLRRP